MTTRWMIPLYLLIGYMLAESCRFSALYGAETKSVGNVHVLAQTRQDAEYVAAFGRQYAGRKVAIHVVDCDEDRSTISELATGRMLYLHAPRADWPRILREVLR